MKCNNGFCDLKVERFLKVSIFLRALDLIFSRSYLSRFRTKNRYILRAGRDLFLPGGGSKRTRGSDLVAAKEEKRRGVRGSDLFLRARSIGFIKS